MASTPCGPEALAAHFGRIDIYLFDQLMRGRITPDMRVLDAGCGGGRNAHYLLRCGAELYGVDRDPDAVRRIRDLAAEVAPGAPAENFIEADLADLPFRDDFFEAVICSAVLHFAPDEVTFEATFAELWRVLERGGVFFARLASTIGIEREVVPLGGRRFRLPDGSDRFLVDEPYLMQLTATVEAKQLDPIKTTNVQNLRAMTTWVLGK